MKFECKNNNIYLLYILSFLNKYYLIKRLDQDCEFIVGRVKKDMVKMEKQEVMIFFIQVWGIVFLYFIVVMVIWNLENKFINKLNKKFYDCYSLN